MRLSIGFILLGLSASVFASESSTDHVYQPGDFYFSPGVAYYHFSDKRDLQNTAMANVSAGYVVSDQFSLEVMYGQASTEETPSALNESTRFYMYSGEGVYHFSSDSEAAVDPYVLTGLTVTNQQDNAENAGNTTLLGLNGGAGIEYFVNPNISLFVDARDIYTLSGGKNDWMLNAGIKFLFGGKDPIEKNEEKVPDPPIETGGSVGFYQLQDSSQF